MFALSAILAFIAGLVTDTTWLWVAAIVVIVVDGLLIAIAD